MACSTPPNQQISYLPTPPTSFNSAYSDDPADHDTSSNTTLTPTRPSIRRQQQTLTQRANIPSIAEAWTPRTPSMSPDPQLVFPTLAMSDERMSPEREMDMRSREGSPELQRELSPCNEDDWEPRSRSSSPETTMRPPPPRFAHEDSDMLGEGTATMVNAKGRGRGTVSSSSSVASFDMLVSYASVAPADRKEAERTMAPPALARQQSYSFKPNTGTMRKITPSFIRDYTPGSGPQGRSSSSKQSPSPTSGSPPRRRSTSSGYFGSISQSQHASRRRVDRQRSADVMEHEDIRLRSSVNTIDTDPTSSSQSGMPSFFERLDGDRAQKGWQYGMYFQYYYYFFSSSFSSHSEPLGSLDFYTCFSLAFQILTPLLRIPSVMHLY